MTAPLVLLGYAALAAWLAPALLEPLTRRGSSVRAGLAAWLAAMASVLASAALALWLCARAAAADWPRLTQTLCRSVAGAACTPEVYRSLAYQAGVTALAAVLVIAASVAAWRYAGRVQRSGARTRSHAQAALVVGRSLPGGPALTDSTERTVMLDDPRPAAYCVAGRPSAIVVTSGALAVLDPPQLDAVLAHESAHLAQRHHVLTTVTRGLAAAVPGVPLFARGAEETARLAEMAADDVAAGRVGRAALVTALLAIATGTAVPSTDPVPANGLAAASRAVPARVERLMAPPRAAAAITGAAALTALALALALAPAALTFLFLSFRRAASSLAEAPAHG